MSRLMSRRDKRLVEELKYLAIVLLARKTVAIFYHAYGIYLSCYRFLPIYRPYRD